jgi:TIR domain
MGEETVAASNEVVPVRLFMSYRRADDRHFIGRLHDRLCEAFGDEMVFRDIDSIPAGTNFRNVILRTLNEVDAVVAVIGSNWARQSEADQPASTDYVFMELAEALKHGKPVIPVLVEATLMPSADVLPADLRDLTDIEAISVYGDPAFRRDSARLIEAIGAVVADDRARIAREQQQADEKARRLEAERSQRERVADELRAEERAARARLAELEDAAARRQIELERARVAAIAEQLRRAESLGEAPAAPPGVAEVLVTPEPSRMPALPVEQPRVVVPPEVRAVPSTSSAVGTAVPWFEVLIIVALILGALALVVDRSVLISGSRHHFNELSGRPLVDAMAWILALAAGVPLVLGNRPVEQRLVLAGVTVSLFLALWQSADAVRYGTTGYSEGSWYLAKFFQIACLIGAYAIVRRRSVESVPGPPRHRVPLVVIAIACGALSIAATYDQWSHTPALIDGGYVVSRSPFVVWLLFLALAPIGVTVALAARSSYASKVTLATIATLAAAGYLSEANSVDDVFHLNGSRWMWAAASYLLLAAVSWWAVAAARRAHVVTDVEGTYRTG